MADIEDLDPDKAPLVVKVYSKPVFDVNVVNGLGVPESNIKRISFGIIFNVHQFLLEMLRQKELHPLFVWLIV